MIPVINMTSVTNTFTNDIAKNREQCYKNVKGQLSYLICGNKIK